MTEFLLGLLTGLPIWGGIALWAVRRSERPSTQVEPQPQCFDPTCCEPGHDHSWATW